MDQKFLVEVMSEFDINYKYFRIIIKNQINRNYGHFYLIDTVDNKVEIYLPNCFELFV